MIVSLHLPKAAGTSFAASLERHFGAALLRDYGDYPLNTPRPERNRAAVQNCLLNADRDFAGVECIHGHFLPVKYLLLAEARDVTFVTWLRHPVDRLLSQYHFWKRTYDPRTALPLQRQVVEEDWSVERHCLGPEARDLYAQFLYAFPLEYFSFIGIAEHYDDDLAYFAKHFLGGAAVEPERHNVGDAAGQGYQIPDLLRREIERYHARDMDVYRRAREIRQTRTSAGHDGCIG